MLAEQERIEAEGFHAETLEKLRLLVDGHCPREHAFVSRLGTAEEVCVNCGKALFNEPLSICIGKKCGFRVCAVCQLGTCTKNCDCLQIVPP